MDGAYDTAAVKARAEAWIDAVNSSSGPSGGWRLQTVQMRTRRKYDGTGSASPGTVTDANGDPVSSEGAKAPDGKCDDLPQRVRRFVPGCPWALVDQAIRYLYRIAPYTGIVYNGVRLEGKYRPTLTQWTRDAQGTSPGKDATYTLTQDLVEITDCDDSLLVTTGVSCSALEETKYFWDRDSVEELPTDCEQGVTYSIRALSRKEDGTYDYQLVRTAARTRHHGPVVVECGVLSETTEETWESAYGEPGNLRGEGCDFTGAIPSTGCDKCGVRTQVSLKRNPDCTYDVVVRRRTAKKVEDSWSDGTACRARDRTVTRQTCDPPRPPVPEVGESVDYSRQVNEDGTYDVSVTVNRAPDPYSYSWTDGTSCRPRSVTRYAAQKSMPKVPRVEPGETLDASVSRNNDCTWDASFSVTGAPEPFVAEWTEGSRCRPVDVRHAQSEPEAPDIPSPGAGETVQVSLSRNGDCTYDSQIRVTRPSEETETSWKQGTLCRIENVTSYQRVAKRPEVPSPKAGETVQASVSRNDDCTWDARIGVTSSPEPFLKEWTEGSQCRPVRVSHAQGAADVPGVPSPGKGETVQYSVSRNGDCTYDCQIRVTGPQESSSASWREGTACETVTATMYESVPEIPDVPVPSAGETVNASFRMNNDCTYSGQVSVSESSPHTLTWTEGGACAPVTTVVSSNQRSVAGILPQGSPAVGTTVQARASRNRDCTYDVSVTTAESAERTDGPYEWKSVVESPGHRYVYSHYVTYYYHVRSFPRPLSGYDNDVRITQNDDCTYSGSITGKKLDSWRVSGGSSGGAGRNFFERTVTAIVDGVRKTRTMRYQVTVYQGDNVPSASTLAHHQQIANGPKGTVIAVDLVDEGKWESVKTNGGTA